MDDVFRLLADKVDGNGELHLNAVHTTALLRFLFAIAKVQVEHESTILRLQEFNERYQKTFERDANEVLKSLPFTIVDSDAGTGGSKT